MIEPTLLQSTRLEDTAISFERKNERRIIDSGAEALTYARTQIAAHGLDIENRPVVVCQNFVVDGSAMQPLSDPLSDVYLGFLGIAAAAAGDTIVTLKTLPGLLDMYYRIGLLAPTSSVIEVNPILDDNVTGYPYTSPLERLYNDETARQQLDELLQNREKAVFVGTFLTDQMRSKVKQLGCDFVQHADPAITNNKYYFGKKSAEYGYSVMPQFHIVSENSIEQAALLALAGLDIRRARGDELGDSCTVAWLKLAGGSGGDFVQKIVVTRDDWTGEDTLAAVRAAITDAYQRLKTSTLNAFSRNLYGEQAREDLWPSDAFAPRGSAIIVEQDARVRGEVCANASNLMVINHDGSYSVEGFFRQITGKDGDYRGSMPFSPEDEFSGQLALDLAANLDAIAGFAHDHQLFGFIGVDFFITQDGAGNHHCVMTEVNGRIPISGTAKIIADKLQAPAWINVNLELPEPIYTIADFERQLGQLSQFHAGDFSACRVVPQAFRTLSNDQTIHPSNRVKALIVGSDQEACLACLEVLGSAGFGK